MLAPYYVMNLSRSEGLSIVPRLFPQHKDLTKRGGDILGNIPGEESLILYVVGHALPDLFWNEHTPISDDVLKEQIREARGTKPTLIVWDACYSMSVLTPGPSPVDGKDPNLARKSKNFWGSGVVHLFSCQSYERTWHVGDDSNRLTIFSQQLKAVLEQRPASGKWEWSALESGLRDRLGRLQRPQIVQAPDGPAASAFL